MNRPVEDTFVHRWQVNTTGHTITNEFALPPGRYRLQAGLPSILENYDPSDNAWCTKGPGEFVVINPDDKYRVVSGNGSGNV